VAGFRRFGGTRRDLPVWPAGKRRAIVSELPPEPEGVWFTSGGTTENSPAFPTPGKGTMRMASRRGRMNRWRCGSSTVPAGTGFVRADPAGEPQLFSKVPPEPPNSGTLTLTPGQPSQRLKPFDCAALAISLKRYPDTNRVWQQSVVPGTGCLGAARAGIIRFANSSRSSRARTFRRFATGLVLLSKPVALTGLLRFRLWVGCALQFNSREVFRC
jgi:hypothetical protein